MVRISKKDRLKRCPRKPFYRPAKVSPTQGRLSHGYKEHENAFTEKVKIRRIDVETSKLW